MEPRIKAGKSAIAVEHHRVAIAHETYVQLYQEISTRMLKVVEGIAELPKGSSKSSFEKFYAELSRWQAVAASSIELFRLFQIVCERENRVTDGFAEKVKLAQEKLAAAEAKVTAMAETQRQLVANNLAKIAEISEKAAREAAEREAANAKLTITLEQSLAENAGLKLALASSQEAQLKERLAMSGEETATERHLHRFSRTTLGSLTEEKEELVSEFSTVRTEIAEAKAALAGKTAEYDDFIREGTALLVEQEGRILRLQDEKKGLSAHLKAAEHQIAVLRARLSSLQQTVDAVGVNSFNMARAFWPHTSFAAAGVAPVLVAFPPAGVGARPPGEHQGAGLNSAAPRLT